MSNLTSDFTGSNQDSFQDTYLRTLRAIIHGQEEKTNYLVNSLCRYIDKGLEDTAADAVRQCYKELKSNGVNHLYGDYKSDSSYPWIQDAGTLNMIDRHVTILSNRFEDYKACQAFIKNATSAYAKEPAHEPGQTSRHFTP